MDETHKASYLADLAILSGLVYRFEHGASREGGGNGSPMCGSGILSTYPPVRQVTSPLRLLAVCLFCHYPVSIRFPRFGEGRRRPEQLTD